MEQILILIIAFIIGTALFKVVKGALKIVVIFAIGFFVLKYLGVI